ncbi:MAG: COG4315 family predicted lipoprotein [Solirubrobacteraceae bacterium]
MLELRRQGAGGRGARGRSTRLALGVVAAALALAAGAALALAVSMASTVNSSRSSKLGERIAVNAQGRTLYALSPETTHHLLCKSAECFKFWPPLTVSSRKAKLKIGPGVHGGLGILRRSNGMLQVTLRGMPLYRFSGDHAKGQVNGQGLKSFGGTWHAVTAAADSHHAPASTEPSAPGTPGYSNPSGGGGYEYPTGTGTSTTTKSTTTSTTTKEEKTTPKEEKTTPKEEKTTPKEETQAEKEAREKLEKEAQEKRHKEYCEIYPTYPGCP